MQLSVAPGLRGGAVVDALLASGQYAVRVATRNPASESAKTLSERGVEVVTGDLVDPGSPRPAFEGAHGNFLVTNAWDPAQMQKEIEIGTAAVKVASASGVQHFVWSTLPDVQKLSGGRLKVPHFTGKARVDAAVRRRGSRATRSCMRRSTFKTSSAS
jgi:uncharacterized protein YbjT (DUF2867 family)